MDEAPRAKSQALREVEAFLRVYAQILFSSSPLVGLLLFAATATVPRAFVGGALAVLTAQATARLLDFDPEPIEAGTYGYNALLAGLGIAQSFAGAEAAALVILAAVACVLLTAALQGSLGATVNLPFLTLPFLAVFHLVQSSSVFVLGAAQTPLAAEPAALGAALAALLPAPLLLFVRSLGALFFLPRADAGALVLAALLTHSRIATSLAALAFTSIVLLRAHALSVPESMGDALGYNAMLSAMALGGVWFVPSTSSFLLALTGTLLTTSITLGLAAPLARLGLPLLIVPFNVALLLLLTALRRRTHDLRPKSVDFLAGTPEENLTYQKTRLQRFQALHPVSFTLPFRGRWACTQAVSGPHTHQGIWRHAFDFEVRDQEGQLFSGSGTSPEHYHCHRLPVLATADGTVVEIENNVPENAIGTLNLEQNWGNHVLLHHAPGLYSLVAHLAKGSLKVAKGQVVHRGEVLGLTGNSGRSPQPHIHFHLQSSPTTGGPTLPCRFSDVVLSPTPEKTTLETAFTPRENDQVRNLEPEDDTAAYFTFDHREPWVFQLGRATERVVAEIDVLGRPKLRSLDQPATLFFTRGEATFTAWDAVGAERSVLHLLRAALSRVPFEAGESLRWTDILPARPYRSFVMRMLFDFLSPFLEKDGLTLELQLRRKGAALIVEGRSKEQHRPGTPVLATKVVLLRSQGPTEVTVTVRGKTRAALRAPREAADPKLLPRTLTRAT
jgi:urea transporter/murein DD-endopeptidase MepM/ murein hydrolase activator NlpD